MPDMWNTKPPLLIWLQALSFKIFTPTVFTFRLPTLIAAITLCFFIYWYFIKYYRNYFIGIITTFILISCSGINKLHGTRTGEYETLLIFFTTTYLIAYFHFLETKNNKWLLLFFMLITAASLTKGIQALFFLPTLLFYTIYTKNIKWLFSLKYFYVGCLSFLFVVIGYYFLREHYNPGFLKAVLDKRIRWQIYYYFRKPQTTIRILFRSIMEEFTRVLVYFINNIYSVKFQIRE